MSEFPENFEFKTPESITPVRVSVVLDALETYGFQEPEPAVLVGENAHSIAAMDEPAVAKYLNDFLRKLTDGSETVASLENHTMFQAILKRAYEME